MKDFGNILLVIGLAGDILVLFIPSRRYALEKGMAALFIVVIIVGVVIDRAAERWIEEPRTLNMEQQNGLAEAFKQFKGQQYAFAVIPDQEPIALTKVLKQLFTKAEWSLSNSSDLAQLVVTVDGADAAQVYGFEGVRVFAKPGSPPNLARTIQFVAAALTLSGIAALPQFNTDMKTDNVIIIAVGNKPRHLPLMP